MKFRNFLASVMAGCARGHTGGSLDPPLRGSGVPWKPTLSGFRGESDLMSAYSWNYG